MKPGMRAFAYGKSVPWTKSIGIAVPSISSRIAFIWIKSFMPRSSQLPPDHFEQKFEYLHLPPRLGDALAPGVKPVPPNVDASDVLIVADHIFDDVRKGDLVL